MAALTPFLEHNDPLNIGDTTAGRGSSGGSSSKYIQDEIAERNLALARQTEIPDDLRYFIDDLADQLIDIPEDAVLRVDPYLLVAAQRALIGSLRALDSDDPVWAKQQMRIRLEQIRQVYRDLSEGDAVYEDRPAKELARWLAGTLDTSQGRIAELVGVSTRTFQRWIAGGDSAGPDGEDARRIRVVARAANHLRHSLTGPGVVTWFETPNAQVKGKRPIDLLDDIEGARQIATLAASTRSHSAA